MSGGLKSAGGYKNGFYNNDIMKFGLGIGQLSDVLMGKPDDQGTPAPPVVQSSDLPVTSSVEDEEAKKKKVKSSSYRKTILTENKLGMGRTDKKTVLG